MSARHPDLVDLVDRLARGDPLGEDDQALLAEYAAAPTWLEDQLDRVTREAVEELTGSDNVWSPQRAARALLATR